VHLKRLQEEQAYYTDISKFDFRKKIYKTALQGSPRAMKEFLFRLRLSEEQAREIALYVSSLPVTDLLFGLRFAYNRRAAENGGYLMPGRKSLVKRETLSLTADQARWRLDNWKKMIKTYREKGYSYPTISRIKRRLYMTADLK
jgi:hypothetical protein